MGEVGPISTDGWGVGGCPRVVAGTFWHSSDTRVVCALGECATIGVWLEFGGRVLGGLVSTARLLLGVLNCVGREDARLKKLPTLLLLPLRFGPLLPLRIYLGDVSTGY